MLSTKREISIWLNAVLIQVRDFLSPIVEQLNRTVDNILEIAIVYAVA